MILSVSIANSSYANKKKNCAFYKVLDVILHCQALQIEWDQYYQKLAAEFYRFSSFPGLIGAVDGTHIRVRAPAAVQKDYLSRKQCHTMILMAICDANMVFMNIASGFPGSVHDQRAFSLTAVGRASISPPNVYFPSNAYHVIGDSAAT